MQKARRHTTKVLRPLVSARFQGLFTPLLGVLFTFPSRYWFTIGLSGVFSLTRWCWQIHTGFLRSRATQDTNKKSTYTCTGLSPSLAVLSRTVLLTVTLSYLGPTTPKDHVLWFGLIPFRSPLLRESLLFSLPLLT